MKVQNIKIKNFKSIEDLELNLNGGNVLVSGSNGAGKSSFIEALKCQIPAEAVKKGEVEGSLIVEFDSYTAVFDLKKGKKELTLITNDGEVLRSPVTTLKKILGVNNFDIDKFLEGSNNERIKTLKRITGVDTSELEISINSLKEEISLTKRDIKREEAVYNEYSYDPEKTTLIDVTGLKEEWGELEKEAYKQIGIKSRIESRAESITENISKIEALRKEIEERQWNIDLMTQKNIEANAYLEKNDIKEKVECFKKRESEADIHNKEVEDTRRAISIKQNIDLLVNTKEELETSLKGKQKELGEKLKLPIDGLIIKENQLFYNGLPFEKDQINTAERIIVGLQIQLHLCGKVKLASFDGSLIDNKNMQKIIDWAKDNNLQLAIEQVEKEENKLSLKIIEK